ncbi:MAG TPA: DegT/DnrJ/EryC1/StrS family aminotransferase [Longilinea sp.]|nr:DegT/DnrJ/EryC1/StrS family aminotransferase [Longilinea sp.]
MTESKTPIVPMSYPDLTDEERQAVFAVVNTPNLSMGPQIDAFETSVRNYVGIKNAVGVNSGTAGLHLCVRAAGIGPGDLVITTPFSFVASTNVLLFENAIPVFVDVDPVTGNIDAAQVEQAARDLTQGGAAAQRWLPRKGAEKAGKLKAILAVDVFGQPADLDALKATCQRYNLVLIEDSCEALGAEYKGKPAGTLGDYGVFAFYPNKQITTGEGGMIITNNDQAAQFMRALRNQGRAPGDNWLQHTYLGYNYRLDEMSAALGVTQMGRIEELLTRRQRVADWYGDRLPEIPGIEPPQLVPDTTRVSWFVYVIRLAKEIDRKDVAEKLAGRGIPVRPYFLPIHLQPYMMEKFGFKDGDFPVTEDLGERGLALPFSGAMTETQVETVCQELAQVIAESKK